MTQLRPTSVTKAIDLLSATKVTLTRHQLPRRRPNIEERPLATSAHGKIVSPYSPGAAKWSLPGALKADSKALGYTKGIVEIAEEYFLKAYAYSGNGEYYGTEAFANVTEIDAWEADTREIIRALRRAIVTLQKQQD